MTQLGAYNSYVTYAYKVIKNVTHPSYYIEYVFVFIIFEQWSMSWT